MLLASFAFQACAIDHSAISPSLESYTCGEPGTQNCLNCDTSLNLLRSLRAILTSRTVIDAEMKGEAEARFSMSSQRRPRSFKEIPTLLRRRVYTRPSMMGIFRQSDGVLHSLR